MRSGLLKKSIEHTLYGEKCSHLPVVVVEVVVVVVVVVVVTAAARNECDRL